MKMKQSDHFLKFTYKLLILMILFVCLFLLSAFLYSVRYWPDIYNYLHANITIKRIPTISEVDFEIINVKVDYTTETYSTTDAEYFEISTIDDFDIDEFMSDKFEVKNKDKRNIPVEEMNEFKDLSNKGVFVDYIFLEEPVAENDRSSDTEENEESFQIHSNLNLLEKLYEANDSKNDIIETTFLKPIKRNHEDRKHVDEFENELDGYLVGDYRNLDKISHRYTLAPFELPDNDGDNEGASTLQFLKDLVDMSKMTTRKLDVELVTEVHGVKKSNSLCKNNQTCESFKHTVFPWVVTIFIKNDSENSQFHYYCDGALLSDIVVLTGGRCMFILNKTVEAENVLVFLGKGNLQSSVGSEKLHRIKEINLHPNFTISEDKITNDLALLILTEPALFAENIQGACIHYNETELLEESATTAWGPNGKLLPIFFDKSDNNACPGIGENLFCATYSLQVALCPSYGGIFAAKRRNRWCLQGLFYGNPADRGLCFNRNVPFTSLKSYINWIDDTIVNKYVL